MSYFRADPPWPTTQLTVFASPSFRRASRPRIAVRLEQKILVYVNLGLRTKCVDVAEFFRPLTIFANFLSKKKLLSRSLRWTQSAQIWSTWVSGRKYGLRGFGAQIWSAWVGCESLVYLWVLRGWGRRWGGGGGGLLGTPFSNLRGGEGVCKLCLSVEAGCGHHPTW